MSRRYFTWEHRRAGDGQLSTVETDVTGEVEALEARLRAAEQRAKILEGAVRSTQDTLLHKVPRSQVVKEQLEVNRAALAAVGGNTP